MVDGFPADIGIGIVLPIRSSQVSLYFCALGFHLWHLDSLSEEFLDKASVMNRACDVGCQKRFPVSQTNSMYQVASVCRGLAQNEDLE